MTKSNVILIGMPGAGKSTVGVVLAKRLGLDFLDADVLLQARIGRRLQQIIDADGLAAFRQMEEDLLAGLTVERTVIATGGSAVYGRGAMVALKSAGTVVFLDVPLPELERRVRDMDTRGLVIDPGQSFAELHARRLPLYRRWADITVDAGGRTVEELAVEIASHLKSRHEKSPATTPGLPC